MNLGISLLFEKPKKEPPQLFSFLSPFSGEVWIYVIGALFFVSFSLFVMGRLSPAEWDNPYPCIEEPEVLENQFSFRNSVWFSIGALLQQGSEIAPKYCDSCSPRKSQWLCLFFIGHHLHVLPLQCGGFLRSSWYHRILQTWQPSSPSSPYRRQ